MPWPTRSTLTLMLLALTAVTVPARAQGPVKERVKREKKAEKEERKAEKREEKEQRKLSEDERRLMRDYFAAHRLEVRPLPPGIARNLALGKPLPPGIRKRYLPQPVLVQLPVYHGYTRYIIGNNIVLVNPEGVVVDIAADIFR